MYSNLACPKGCSWSEGFADIKKEIKPTMEEMASNILFMPSPSTLNDPLRIPAKILLADKNMLTIPPTIDTRIPTFLRSSTVNRASFF